MESRAVSRREFLKIAGIAGATVGVGVGLGGLIAGCGGETTTTTTAGATTTTVAASTTTVSAGPEAGRPIKIGLVTPVTGPLAVFATGNKWLAKRFADGVGDGVVLANKKKHPFELIERDAQSDSNRAAQVTGDLIQNDNVDLIMATGSPEMVNPSADQADALGCPYIADMTIWQAFVDRPGAGPDGSYKWTYTFCYGAEQSIGGFIGCYMQIPSNNKLALLFANDADGNAWAESTPPAWQGAGYTTVMPGLFQPGSEDYTAQISQFKKEGCELLCGNMLTPDFTNFWKQAVQQSFQPKVVCVSKALLFPQAVEALGPIAYNLCCEGAWQPSLPFKDSLSGMTCPELRDDFETFTGTQWNGTICMLAKYEWAVDIFKRTTNIDDKEATIAAIKSTKLDTSNGPIDFTAPIAENSHRPTPNVYTGPGSGAQWVKGAGKWPFDMVVVVSLDPTLYQAQAKVQPLTYS